MTETNDGKKMSDREKQLRRSGDLREALTTAGLKDRIGISTLERDAEDGKKEIILNVHGISKGVVDSSIGQISVTGLRNQLIGDSTHLTREVLGVDLTRILPDQQGRLDQEGRVREVGINQMGIGAEQINRQTMVWVVVSGTTRGDITPKLS
ncbi:MAG: hypothetical protein RLZZ455_911 [Candidatus Parcubacteria bacterium]|jgi:hypothetical protein